MTTKILVSAWGTPDPLINLDQWEEMEASAGLTFPPERRARISYLFEEYSARTVIYSNAPRASEVKPILDEIVATATDLANALSKLTTRDKRGRGARQALNREVGKDRREYFDPRAISATARQLATDAAAASKACSQDRGQPDADPYVGALARLLHHVYQVCGGKGGPYARGPTRFLMCACQLAGAKVSSEKALHQRMKAEAAKEAFW